MVKGFMRRMAQCGEGFYAWITLPDHRDLWKAPLTRRVRAEKPSQRPSTARSLCPISDFMSKDRGRRPGRGTGILGLFANP